jgi:hypothetical protein
VTIAVGGYGHRMLLANFVQNTPLAISGPSYFGAGSDPVGAASPAHPVVRDATSCPNGGSGPFVIDLGDRC